MDIFSVTNAGRVIKTRATSRGFVTLGDGGILQGTRLLCTGVKFERSQAIQTSQTLNNTLFAYAFGEQPGRVFVSGIVFLGEEQCGGDSSNAIKQLNDYYAANNAYTRGSFLDVVIGGVAFQVLLQGFAFVAEMTPYNYGSFSLSFVMIPSKK